MSPPPRASLVEEAESLLAELDRTSKPTAPAEGRRDGRVPYRRSLRLERRNSAGAKIASWIYARDLSAGGLGCLALEMVEPGTAVAVHLPSGGGVDEIGAHVVHSRHMREAWHVLGLKFNNPLEPGRYIGEE